MALEPDIIERIKRDFDAADASTAIERLTASGHAGRVARCIIVASRGKLQSLRDHIEMASNDVRDVISAGEYDGMVLPVRDLSCSFLVDSLDAFWIASVANVLHARGFVLKSIVTRPATNGPFVYTSDYGEGVATFAGEMGDLRISKRDRKWTLEGDPAELELYGLNRAFDDESEFADEVSCYILAKLGPNRAARGATSAATSSPPANRQ